MHLRVFLFANPFRWRSRRTGTYDVWKHESCIKLKCRDALWRWNTLKRRPQHYTLGFYTKVQVWGRMVRTSPHVPSTPKVTLVKKKNDDDSSILLKKEREKKIWYIYIYEKRKKERAKQRERKRKWYIKKRERKGAVRQCSYSRPFPLPPRPMVYAHYLCVWPRPSYSPEKDHVRSSHRCSSFKHHPHMLQVKTLRYAKVNKMFTNSLTHICLHEIIHIHASVVYVMCSGLGVHTWYIHSIFKLSMVLRLK